MLLQWPEDAGEHLGDPYAGGSESGGFVLTNGQHDTYADADTAPFEDALVALHELIDGLPLTSPDRWIVDRAPGEVDWRIQPGI